MTALHLAHNTVHFSCNMAIVIKGQEGIEVFRMYWATLMIVSGLIPELDVNVVFSA